MSEPTFKGYAVTDKDWKKFTVQEFQSKKLGIHDVQIGIKACGICSSDCHTITQGWGPAPLPLVVGHEIVGVAEEVGSAVKGIKKGDRVGVGAQVWSCMNCDLCKNDNENYCPHMVDTYGANYPDSSWPNAKELGLNGEKTMGGYANRIRTHEQFVFPVPEGMEDTQVAPLFCAGLTVYSPLVRNGTGPGKKVAIIGIGGLGHYAVQIAVALGAEVYALTHSASKVDDIKKMGAHHVINTGDKDWNKDYQMKFDFILSTVDNAKGLPITDLLPCLKVESAFHTVGLPDGDLPPMKAQNFAMQSLRFQSSHIGSKKEMLELLDLAKKHGIKTWAMEVPAEEKAIGEAVRRVVENDDVKYRFVITNLDKALA